MKCLRRFGLTAALLVVLATAIGVGPASASTLPGMPACSTGDLVGRYTAGGGGLAELDLFWDATHKTNCAEMVHLGAAYGHTSYGYVEISTCQGDTPRQACVLISATAPYYGYDAGSYAYFAGPASVTGAGHCIAVTGDLDWNGKTYVITSDPNNYGVHC